jgi:D-xylose transport system substrate-binding protein
LGLAAGLAITSVAACGGGGGSTTSGGSASGGGAAGKKIALLLPESKTARYESKDRPLFTAAV